MRRDVLAMMFGVGRSYVAYARFGSVNDPTTIGGSQGQWPARWSL